MADEVIELHGDRGFGDDPAMVAGFARIDGRRIAFVGQQKGADTDENIRRNFGMPHPEGYRKSMRIMELAERFGLPIVTFVDVPGAHPGPESEERGIAEAIARSIGLMSRLRTPIVAIITGEGGSGGALAIAVGDVVIALENAVYSVISPEGCASILWRTADEAPTAALAMRMSAQDQLELGVIDRVVPEPGEGAHADPRETARRLRSVIIAELDRLAALTPDELVEARYRRYRALGPYTEVGNARGGAPAQPGARRSPSRPARPDALVDGHAAAGLVETRRAAGPRGGLIGARRRPPARTQRRRDRRRGGRAAPTRPGSGPRGHRAADRGAPAGADRQARHDAPRRARGPRGRLARPAPPAVRDGARARAAAPPTSRRAPSPATRATATAAPRRRAPRGSQRRRRRARARRPGPALRSASTNGHAARDG